MLDEYRMNIEEPEEVQVPPQQSANQPFTLSYSPPPCIPATTFTQGQRPLASTREKTATLLGSGTIKRDLLIEGAVSSMKATDIYPQPYVLSHTHTRMLNLLTLPHLFKIPFSVRWCPQWEKLVFPKISL